MIHRKIYQVDNAFILWLMKMGRERETEVIWLLVSSLTSFPTISPSNFVPIYPHNTIDCCPWKIPAKFCLETYIYFTFAWKSFSSHIHINIFNIGVCYFFPLKSLLVTLFNIEANSTYTPCFSPLFYFFSSIIFIIIRDTIFCLLFTVLHYSINSVRLEVFI